MELLGYWKIIRKRLLLILAIGLIGTGIAAYRESQQVPIYSTTTMLFLNPAAANPLLPYQATKSVQSTANTYIEFIRTRSFALLVAEQSGLALTPQQVLGSLSAQYVPDTQFFRMTATTTDPVVAQTIANTAANTLLAENVARQQAQQAQIQSQRDLDPDRQQLAELRNSLRDELTLYAEQIENTQEQVNNLEVRSPSERNDDRLTELRTELVSLQQSRAQTLNSLAQVQSAMVAGSVAAGAVSTDTAVIVDPAPLPVAQPRPFVRNVLLGLVLALALGAGLAVGLEYLDYTVKNPEALESAYGMRVQGVIGVVQGRHRRADGKADPGYQLTVSEPHSAAAESIRALRTSLQIASLNRPIRSMLVTSAGPGEGKTFVAANLAVSLAQYGASVILVDLDLRKPNLHAVFGVPREPGFSNLVIRGEADILDAIRPQLDTIFQHARNRDDLRRHAAFVGAGERPSISLARAQVLLRDAEAGDPDLEQLIASTRKRMQNDDELAGHLQPSGVPNLLLLTCGAIPPEPSELLGSALAAHLMERLKEQADIVIFDSPPAGIVTDAVILAPRVDAIMQVVRAGSTRIDLMRRCKTTLEHASGHLLGPVLNQVRLSEMGSYSYYYYYGYGEKAEAARTKSQNGKHP